MPLIRQEMWNIGYFRWNSYVTKHNVKQPPAPPGQRGSQWRYHAWLGYEESLQGIQRPDGGYDHEVTEEAAKKLHILNSPYWEVLLKAHYIKEDNNDQS